MKASKETIQAKDSVIFRCDEYGDGNIRIFDGSVCSVEEAGVYVSYLSGYKSRNDLIPFSDVIAKVDVSKPRVKLAGGSYSGYFLVFS